MAKRGRPVSENGVLPRITNRNHLLAALVEGIYSRDLHHISHAVNSVGVIKNPIERELMLDLGLKLSRLIEQILRGTD